MQHCIVEVVKSTINLFSLQKKLCFKQMSTFEKLFGKSGFPTPYS